MSQDPYSGRGPDGEEPDGSGMPPAEEYGPTEDDGSALAGPVAAAADDEEPDEPPEGAEQGLYVCLPAEELTLAGFAQDGRADTMAPGPLMAVAVHAVVGEDGAGLRALSDDQLLGILSAARRMESRAAWTQMAAMNELARRRPAAQPAGKGPAPARISEFAADEVAAEFRLTWQSAVEQVAYACAVAERLPRTFAALAAGQIHPVHVRIIEDETSVLSVADAATADEQLAEAAAAKSFGQLRSAAHRLVLRLDPEAPARRKERAQREAHVRRFREDSGNAGMVAREMSSDEVLASWQHVEQRALDLRTAGVPGTLRELRVRAYLDLLQERDCRAALTGLAPGQADNAEGRENGLGGPRSQDGGTGFRQDRDVDSGARRDEGPSLAALVNITVPLSALQGDTGPPGEAAGFGLLDHQSARDLVAAAARSRNTRWCVTALHPDGTAAAHGCAAGPGHGFPAPARPALQAPAPSIRPDCCVRWVSSSTRSSAARATTPRPSAGTDPGAPSDTWSRPATPGAPPRAAPGPRPGATWITPAPGTTADLPVRVTSPRCAVTIIGASKPPDGGWNRQIPAS